MVHSKACGQTAENFLKRGGGTGLGLGGEERERERERERPEGDLID